MVGRLGFDVQGGGGRGRGGLAQFGPIWTDRKREKGVQKLDIFLGCHKCMIPNLETIISKLSSKYEKLIYMGDFSMNTTNPILSQFWIHLDFHL